MNPQSQTNRLNETSTQDANPPKRSKFLVIAVVASLVAVVSGILAWLIGWVWLQSENVTLIIAIPAPFAMLVAFEMGGWEYAVRKYERPKAIFIFAHVCVLIGNAIGFCILYIFADAVGHRKKKAIDNEKSLVVDQDKREADH